MPGRIIIDAHTVAAAICLSFTLAWGHLLVSPQVSVFFVEYGGFLFLPALLAEFACPFAMFLLLTSRRHSLGTFIRLVLAELLLCLTLPYLLRPAVW